MIDKEPMTLEDVLKFPCDFTIKVMGVNVPELINEVSAIVAEKSVGFDPKRDIKIKPSSKGNYVALDVKINAESKKQLDSIYIELNNHSLVKITL